MSEINKYDVVEPKIDRSKKKRKNTNMREGVAVWGGVQFIPYTEYYNNAASSGLTSEALRQARESLAASAYRQEWDRLYAEAMRQHQQQQQSAELNFFEQMQQQRLYQERVTKQLGQHMWYNTNGGYASI